MTLTILVDPGTVDPTSSSFYKPLLIAALYYRSLETSDQHRSMRMAFMVTILATRGQMQ